MQTFQNYQPSFYRPTYPTYQPAAPQAIQPAAQEIIRVTGVEGARAYPIAPNSRVALFDDGRDVFYIKSADGGGYPTLTAFTFAPLQDAPAASADYVTRAEFEELKELVANGKQPVRRPSKPAED